MRTSNGRHHARSHRAGSLAGLIGFLSLFLVSGSSSQPPRTDNSRVRVDARSLEQTTTARSVDWWPYALRPPFDAITPGEESSPAVIKIGNARFLAHQGPPQVPEDLMDRRLPFADGGYFVLHCTEPLSADKEKQLRRDGIHTIRAVPRNSYLVWLEASALPALSRLAAVDGVFRYEPAYKISPEIGTTPVSREELDRRGASSFQLRIAIFPGEQPAAVAEEIVRRGAEILAMTGSVPLDPGVLPDGRARARPPAYVEIRIPTAVADEVIPHIARLDAVRWIEESAEYRALSDWTVSGWNYGGSRSAGTDFLTVRQPWNNGLHGEGVLVGSVDTGIDFDHLSFADPVLPAMSEENPPTMACSGTGPKNSLKVPVYHLAPPSGGLTPVCYDQSSESTGGFFGHGTATAGLMAADPTASDNLNIDAASGTAPEAQIWMYDVGPASGGALAIDVAALINELESMGAAGASAVNLAFVNSATEGNYDLLAEILDAAAWNEDGLLPIQGAGNDGANSGVGSLGSVDSTGKNVLTVGGILDDEPDDLYPQSSRGLTEDSRFKPDVLAPAHNSIGLPNPNPDLDETLLLLSSDGSIVSNNSGVVYGAEGTSFSAPSVAGQAGVVSQYFRDGFYPTGQATPADAMPAANHLIKGMIVNSAVRLTGAGVTDDARPGKDQGWGRVRLNDPLYFSMDPDTGDDPRKLAVFQGSFRQGPTSCPADAESFAFDLFNIEEELRITLTWTDYPGDSGTPSADQIVNDLDLIVTGPLGAVYRGNVFDATGTGYSILGGTADQVNTVENVWLPAGEGLLTGEYLVEVCPQSVIAGIRQDFSLVVTGGMQAGETLQFDQLGYSCQDTVGVQVEDLSDPGPTVDVVVISQTTGDSETLTLEDAGRTGLYSGAIPTATAAGPPVLENGWLEVTDGEAIQATYLGSTDAAIIECGPTVCYATDLGALLQHECDNDGFADNGETIHLSVPLRNDEGFPVHGAYAVLSSGNPHVTVLSDTATYGTIPAGAVAYPDDDGTDDPFVISISGAACDEPATLTLIAIEGSGWDSSSCAVSTIDLQLNRDPYPLQTWDFDDGSPQGWTHEMAHGTRPSEECDETYVDEWNTFPTTDRSHSGSYSMQLGNGDYGVMLDSGLVSPPVGIPSGGALLKFHYWMDADFFDDLQTWHGFIVEASSNAGATWTQITPVDGYNAYAGRNDCGFQFPFGNTAPAFLGLFGGDGAGAVYTGDAFDKQWTVDLSTYASQTIQVRFRFGSDDYPGAREGLYIDTVILEGFQCESLNVCDDGESCTTDTCDAEAGGCQHAPLVDGASCDDEEACTATDECSAGVCGGTEVISCDDANDCTDDTARDDGDDVCSDPVADCRHVNNTAPCDDANACSTEDICADGACTGGPTLDCNDLNPCTDDLCSPSLGCENVNNTATCSDPYGCTETDVCVGGQCVGSPKDTLCDDSNICTSGTCNPAHPGADTEGCVQTPVADGLTCDDESLCTTDDECFAGVCGGLAVDCTDGATCTEDLCEAESGCHNPGVDSDGDSYDICGPSDPVNPDGHEKDCRDQNADVNPGAEEDCFNSQDDDCNGQVDAADTLGCPRSDISGTMLYYRDTGGTEPSAKPVSSVIPEMVGTSSGSTSTDAGGYYEFTDILKGLVSVIPRKMADFGGSISSLDAARVSQHRVGMITLTPRQQVAGDVSGNGTISSFDAALISQFRVGLITRMPVAVTNDSDWAFEPDQRDYAPIDSDRPGEDYLGILYGDVTGNWEPPGGSSAAVTLTERFAGEAPTIIGRTSPSAVQQHGRMPGRACELSLRPVRESRRAGEQRFVLHASGAEELLSLDLDLAYSPEVMSIVSVSTTESSPYFTLISHDVGGLLRVSMYSSQPLAGDGPLLELVVKARGRTENGIVALEGLANEGQLSCQTSGPKNTRFKRKE